MCVCDVCVCDVCVWCVCVVCVCGVCVRVCVCVCVCMRSHNMTSNVSALVACSHCKGMFQMLQDMARHK